MFGLLLIMYDLIWLPMQVFEPVEGDFFFIVGLVSSLYWSGVPWNGEVEGCAGGIAKS